jgi:hypothetical protein
MPGRFRTQSSGLEAQGAAEVAKLSKGSRGGGTAGSTGRSANPMRFPRSPKGDIILGAPIELLNALGAC